MKYKAEVVAYESYGEVCLGELEVEADDEEEADEEVSTSVEEEPIEIPETEKEPAEE